jgi:hypothetical protein
MGVDGKMPPCGLARGDSGGLPSRHHRSRGPKKTGLPARKATAGSPLAGRASASPSLLARRHLPLWRWPTDPGCEGPDSSPPVSDLLRAAALAAHWLSSGAAPPATSSFPTPPTPFSFVIPSRGLAGGRPLRRDACVASLGAGPCFPKCRRPVAAFPPLGYHGCHDARVPTWARCLAPRCVPPV